jgi:ADP-heptose:LPS heptosyltransferase
MARFLVSTIGMMRPDATRQCVEQALRHARDADFILTSNGCAATADAFEEMARQHPNVTHVRNDQNEGFQRPNNAAFHEAARRGYEYFVALNDDCMVPDGFLQALAVPLDQDGHGAISGPAGGCQHLSNEFHGEPGELEYVEGSLMMVKIAVMRSLRPTLFWDRLHLIYGEDSEASLFVREKGYNIHKVAMKIDHARSQTVNRTPEVQALCRDAQQRNHTVCKERYQYYLDRRRFNFPLVIRRAHSLGDVILVTALIRALHKTLPLCPIHVETDYPEVFARNPLVTSTARQIPRQHGELRIQLDMAYENETLTHIVHAYEAMARRQLPGLEPVELRTGLYPAPGDEAWAEGVQKELGSKPFVVMHTDHTHWTGRNIPHERFHDLAEWLHGQGIESVAVGRGPMPQLRAKDLCGKTSLHQLAALCARAKMFFGGCSGPLHVAQAVGCPAVGAFGVTRGRFILTHRGPAIGVDGAGEDAGVRHATAGQSFVEGNGSAIRSITTEQIRRACTLLLA